MRDVQSTVMGITSTTTKTGKTMYTVKLATGEEATAFLYGVVQKAANSGGQTCTFRIEDVVKGTSTYHNLKEVFLPGEFVAPVVPQAGTPIAFGNGANGAIPITPAAPSSNGGGGGRGMSETDKIRITKLAGYGTAASGLLRSDYPTLAEYLDELDAVAQHVYRNARSHETPSEAAPAVAQGITAPVDPAAIVAAAQAAGQPVALGAAGIEAVPEAVAPLPWSTS